DVCSSDLTHPQSEDSFQRLLLRIAQAVSAGGDTRSLIRLFCETTRQFFQVAGVYFWEVQNDELASTEADGLLAESFRGRRLSLTAGGSAVAVDVVRNRKTTYVNELDHERYPMAKEFGSRS